MTPITTLEKLRDAIRELEDQNYVNEQFLRQRVSHIVEQLKPMNLLRSLVHRVVAGPETKTNLLRMAAGFATSFVLKKFFKRRA